MNTSLFAVFLIFVPQFVHAQSAESIINKMRFAMDHLNYQGTYIYKINNRFDTIKLEHIFHHHKHFERLTSLSGEAREVIRTDKEVSCIMPDQHTRMVDKTRNQFSAINQYKFLPENLSPFYQIALSGEQRVAGKASYIIDIKPVDQYRYGHTLWIDKEHYFLLKSTMQFNKQIIEEISFTGIDLIPPEEIENISAAIDYSNKMQVKKSTNHEGDPGKAGWHFTQTPPGYRFYQYVKKIMDQSGNEIKQWLFSDGLASYSVFIKKAPKIDNLPLNVVKMGAVNVYSRKHGPWLLTIMGEVPEKTILYASNGILQGNPDD